MNVFTLFLLSHLKQPNGRLLVFTQMTQLQVIACIPVSLPGVSYPQCTSQGAWHAVAAERVSWMEVAKGWGQPSSSPPTIQL